MEDCIDNHQSFEFFLKNFTSLPFVRDDMHWRTIYSRIDAKWWPYIDFVGYMENLNSDTEEFLSSVYSKNEDKNDSNDAMHGVNGRKVSAWEKMGKSGWGNYNGTAPSERDCTRAAIESDGPFMGVPRADHATRAREQMMEFYTPELEALVEERYKDDLNNPFFHFSELKLFPEYSQGSKERGEDGDENSDNGERH